tara:strand:+ start:15919 stop:16326 length:408 start_codon:yes stop_codon:yes gene_type:complete
MKFTYTILIALLIFSSCSSNDDETSNEDSSIVGTWIGVSSTFNGETSGTPDNSIVKFTSNNETEFIYEGFGNDGEDITETGSWAKSGNTLTITWDESDSGLETYVLTITEISGTTLTWETAISGEGTLSETFQKQ